MLRIDIQICDPITLRPQHGTTASVILVLAFADTGWVSLCVVESVRHVAALRLLGFGFVVE
jgi:hypothetical protein